jgi:hypothetical protein
MAKFNHQTGAWESIDMSSVDDSVISINQVRIDRDNQLWCTFPGHYLVKMDLATGTIWKSAIGGPTVRYTWLNESTCGQEPALGLMPDGNILIGANGKVLYGTSGSAVISRVSPKVVRGNFQVLGVFDPLGRKITANSFSAHSFPAGNYFTVTRSANGTIKAEKHSIVR